MRVDGDHKLLIEVVTEPALETIDGRLGTPDFGTSRLECPNDVRLRHGIIK